MPGDPDAGDARGTDRRHNLLLRSLIDEMMVQVRELRAHSGPWPVDERLRAEADLERIIGQVRTEALRKPE